MDVKKIEIEENYDKEGHDRVWFHISGYYDGTDTEVDGKFGVIDGSIVCENGETLDENSDRDLYIAVKRALDM